MNLWRRDRNWIIMRNAHDNVWVQVTAMVAPTAKSAIERATAGSDYTYGTYLAIPGRVWAKQIRLGS